MSDLYKVSLVYTGNIDSVERYLDDAELSFLTELINLDSDLPIIRIQESDTFSLASKINGKKLHDNKFHNLDSLVGYLRSEEFNRFGKVPGLEDIIGMYEGDDTVTLHAKGVNDLDITIVTNAACKSYTVPDDTELCILIDTRNPEMKLNINMLSNILGDFTGQCLVYSEFSESELVSILPNADISVG